MKEGEEGVAVVRRVIPVMVAVMGLALLVGGARIASATHIPGSPGVVPAHWAEACQTVGGFPANFAGAGGVAVCPPETTLVTVFKLVDDGLGVVYSCCVPN